MNFVKKTRTICCVFKKTFTYPSQTISGNNNIFNQGTLKNIKRRTKSSLKLVNNVYFKNAETKALYGPLLVTSFEKKKYLSKLEEQSQSHVNTRNDKKHSRLKRNQNNPIRSIKLKSTDKSKCFNHEHTLKKSDNLFDKQTLSISDDIFVTHHKTKKTLEKNVLSHDKTFSDCDELFAADWQVDNKLPFTSIDNSFINIEAARTSPSSKNISFPLCNSRLDSNANLSLFHSSQGIYPTPSVTKILQITMPSERVKILEQWKRKMIKGLGEEGFYKYHQETLHRGITLHENIGKFLSGAPKSEIHIASENEGNWHSLSPIFEDISKVEVLEKSTKHPYLNYTGVVDCIASYKGQPCIIDWKTSQKPKPFLNSMFDNPLQVVAYLGAVNFDKNFNYQVENTLIVVAYHSGAPAHAHFMPKHLCMKYWSDWLKRLQLFWEIKVKDEEKDNTKM